MEEGVICWGPGVGRKKGVKKWTWWVGQEQNHSGQHQHLPSLYDPFHPTTLPFQALWMQSKKSLQKALGYGVNGDESLGASPGWLQSAGDLKAMIKPLCKLLLLPSPLSPENFVSALQAIFSAFGIWGGGFLGWSRTTRIPSAAHIEVDLKEMLQKTPFRLISALVSQSQTPQQMSWGPFVLPV